MKKALPLYYLLLTLLIAVQLALTIGHIGTGIGGLTAYAQLQKERTQLEVKKTQLLAEYARSQALQQDAALPNEFIALTKPITVANTAATADRSLSNAQ